MKILFTSPSYYPEICGVQRVVQEISERLAARSHSVCVATKYRSDRTFTELNNVHIEQFDISGSSLKGWRGETKKFREFIKTSDFDLIVNVYTRYWTTDLVFPYLAEIKAKKILMAGGFAHLPSWKWMLYRFVMKRKIKYYDHIIYHQHNDHDHIYGNKLKIKDYTVIENGVSESEFLGEKKGFKEKYNIHEARMFLCISNYGVLKNQEFVVRAFQKANIKDSVLVLIGSKFNTYSDQLKQIIQSNPSNHPIIMLEEVPRELLVAALFEAEMFLFGSLVECFPLVILEAMAAGTPFISTDVGSVKYLPGGQIVNSIEEMARSMNNISSGTKIYEALAMEGRQSWEQNYRWDAIVNKYENLFESLVHDNSFESK